MSAQRGGPQMQRVGPQARASSRRALPSPAAFG